MSWASLRVGDELTERKRIAAGHLHEPVDHLPPDRMRHPLPE